MKLNDLILLEGTISFKDKQTIHAFTNQEKGDSRKFSTDGKTLDGLWMGGRDIAKWKNGKIVLGNLDSHMKQKVHKIIRRMVGKAFLGEGIIFETAAAGMTSVDSIGSLETQLFPALIRLYKRDDKNVPKCVAKICRKKGEGWSMMPTEGWGELNLPHFGNVVGAKTPKNGKKTISSNLPDILKQWGITHGDIKIYGSK